MSDYSETFFISEIDVKIRIEISGDNLLIGGLFRLLKNIINCLHLILCKKFNQI